MSPLRKAEPAIKRTSRLRVLSGFLVGRPRLVFGVWVAAAVVLALLGRNLSGELRPHPLLIDGSEPKLAHEITLRQFGSDESMVVALRGPEPALEQQGRLLDARIDASPKTVVVSPWSAGGAAIGGLRPKPGVAGIVVRVGHRGDQGIPEMLDLVEGEIEKTISSPVHASIAGLPTLFASYTAANEDAAKTGEMIAIPVLLIVLLLVFRSVIAALIPVAVGGVVVSATDGVMRLLLGLVEIDAFALAAAGMMGLALGVDYSLLVVSRFREERKKADPDVAARATVEAVARSIVPAASGLCLAMLIAAQILPGTVVSSAALAIVIATVLSAVSALSAVPAAILLLGRNLDRWSLPARYSARGAPLRFTSWIVRSPRAVGGIVLVLLFLGAWATTLKSGLATPQLLPPGDRGRVEEEQVQAALGPGWLAPIEVVLSERGEPMTAPRRMHSLVAFQDELGRESGVQTVTGFNTIAHNLHPLVGFEERLVKREKGAAKLSDGISRTEVGARRNSSGVRKAAAGTRQVGQGVESATDGAGLLAEGLRASNNGSARETEGLLRVSEGTEKLSKSTSSTRDGTGRLVEALEKAKDKVAETQGSVQSTKGAMRAGTERLQEAQGPLGAAEARLEAAWGALEQMTTGASDPQYATVQRELREARETLSGTSLESEEPTPTTAGVAGAITRAQREFDLGLYLAKKIGAGNIEAGESTGKLVKSSRRLDRGMQSLADGVSKMASAMAELSAEGGKLSPALQRLRAGTESLAQNLGRLGGGVGSLASGLGGGTLGAERLVRALGRLHGGLGSGSEARPSPLSRLQERSPNLFRSGYFYLAGLDGSNASRRSIANFAIDVGHGGHTARMMVIPRQPITTSAGKETYDRVRSDAQAFAGSTGTAAVVGGLSSNQLVIDQALRDRSALARIAMMIVTLLVLIPVLRSLIVPVLAAFLNLLTVAASLGILALLFNDSLFGGPGYVDSSVIPAAMMVIFGLAIDYEVFIFARIREEYVRTGSTTAAVDNGIARTAPVVTGAAIIMIVVFLCFSVSEFVTLRDFGAAQATAVFIDAFIVRLIVVPAIMKRLGRWSWWLPKWLDRLLPGGQQPVRERSATA
jgi:putative drug exporter of the RND superfamily